MANEYANLDGPRLPRSDLVVALDKAGFQGLYDVESFSDNGQYGHKFPDSLWALPPKDIVRRAIQIFEDI